MPTSQKFDFRLITTSKITLAKFTYSGQHPTFLPRPLHYSLLAWFNPACKVILTHEWEKWYIRQTLICWFGLTSLRSFTERLSTNLMATWNSTKTSQISVFFDSKSTQYLHTILLISFVISFEFNVGSSRKIKSILYLSNIFIV